MDDRNNKQAKTHISLIQLFWAFFRIGVTGFGLAMLIEVKKNIVKRLGWLGEEELLEGLALAQLIPGATFVSLTTYIGYRLRGLFGAIISLIGFLLPGFSLVVALSWLYFRYQSIEFVTVLFAGLGAVVVALILNAVWDLAKTTTNTLKTIIIATTAFTVSIFYNNIFLILIISALMGILLLRKKAEANNSSAGPEKPKINYLDIILICIALVLFFSLTSLYADLFSLAGVFFKIGALVFGNGFTMLPLIQQEVVDVHHWLSPEQFMVGVALGQMTPGPVTITAAFVGYKLVGLLGALVATIAIFSPSFLLVITIFGVFTKIKNNRWVSAALTGLIASFVGLMSLVVINMGKFALVDIPTIGIFLLSFALLQFVKLDSKWVILVGTGVYLIVYYLQVLFF